MKDEIGKRDLRDHRFYHVSVCTYDMWLLLLLGWAVRPLFIYSIWKNADEDKYIKHLLHRKLAGERS